MVRILFHRLKTPVCGVVSILGLGMLAVSCSQDPAFLEKSLTEQKANVGEVEADQNRTPLEPLDTQQSGDSTAATADNSTAENPDTIKNPNGTEVKSSDGSIATSDSKGDDGKKNDGTTINIENKVVIIGGVVIDQNKNPNGSTTSNTSNTTTTTANTGNTSTATPTPTSTTTASEPHAGEEVSVTRTQVKPAAVDILWLVDNSGSMSWAQNQLTSNFDLFATNLKNAGVGNYQVGVSSLNVCGTKVDPMYCPLSAGGSYNLQGTIRGILQPSQSDFVTKFKSQALLGTSGSAYEHGLTAARMAIEKKADVNSINNQFFRKDSYLSIIIVSDEEDQGLEFSFKSFLFNFKSHWLPISSTLVTDAAKYGDQNSGSNNNPGTLVYKANDFVNFANSKIGAGKVQVNAITSIRDVDGKIAAGSNGKCGSNTTIPKEAGSNYIEAARLTQGTVQNICEPDWAKSLADVAKKTVQLVNKFELVSGRIPFPGTLVVKVNGTFYQDFKYKYDSIGNFIVFEDEYIPPVGATISISYKDTAK